VDEWEAEFAFYVNHKGFDHDKALTWVILRWLWHGDLRPLSWAIWQGYGLDEAVLNALAIEIDAGRLAAKPYVKTNSRPKDPAKFIRDYIAAEGYNIFIRAGKSSEEAFVEVADYLSTSPETVRRAVTERRKK
jgi:hypothetical protein